MSSAGATLEQPDMKPLLRGWLHAGAALVAAVATPWLLAESRSEPAQRAAVTFFALATVLLYAVSALYHIGTWRKPVRRLLARLDYANIFIFIAASHTVLCVLAAPEHSLPSLALVWILGGAGIACVIAMPCLRRRVRTALYILVAWAGVASAPLLQAALAPSALLLLLGSALSYLLGGAIYAWQRPNPLPAVFGFHELFHLLTIVANCALATAIWIWLPPAANILS